MLSIDFLNPFLANIISKCLDLTVLLFLCYSINIVTVTNEDLAIIKALI